MSDLSSCPICQSGNVELFFPVKDHSVSGETFQLMQCLNCTVRFTMPVPQESSIWTYYQSKDYISHTNEQKGFIGWLYRIVRKWTLRRKSLFVVKQTKKNIGMHLDLGAGTGSFVHAMERHGWNTIGFEPIERARKLANRLFKASIYPLEDFFQIPVAGGYDAITLWHTLEHVYHLHPTFERLSKLLSKNGKLFIAVPNYTSYDASYYKENWAAYDVPRHLYHFSPQSIQYLAQKYQLKVVSIKPLWFDSTYISLMSERYRKGFVLFGFVIGFISNWITLFNKKRCSSILYILQKEIIEEEI